MTILTTHTNFGVRATGKDKDKRTKMNFTEGKGNKKTSSIVFNANMINKIQYCKSDAK